MSKKRKATRKVKVRMKKTITVDVDTLQKFEEVRMTYLREKHQLPTLSTVVQKGIEAVWKETCRK